MTPKKSDFVTAIGRRKSAVARVKLNLKTPDGFSIMVNDRNFSEYFNFFEWQDIIVSPLKLVGQQKIEALVKVAGGGIKAQAEAIRLGIARALLSSDATLRATLRSAGYLTRDDRIKERKKPGLKRARRAPQWSKR